MLPCILQREYSQNESQVPCAITLGHGNFFKLIPVIPKFQALITGIENFQAPIFTYTKRIDPRYITINFSLFITTLATMPLTTVIETVATDDALRWEVEHGGRQTSAAPFSLRGARAFTVGRDKKPQHPGKRRHKLIHASSFPYCRCHVGSSLLFCIALKRAAPSTHTL